MVNDFSRTLSLLRHEKKISQRQAAKDLGISQALLSHYENGVREPGLAFVARAAGYYRVSADYLLGLSMSRDGVIISADELPDVSAEKGNVLSGSARAILQKKLIVNSAALVLDIASRSGNADLRDNIADILALTVYKAYRHIFALNPNLSDNVFSIPVSQFSELSDAQIKLCEFRIKTISDAGVADSLPDLSHDALGSNYPSYAQSFFKLLQSVAEILAPLKTSAENDPVNL